MEDDRTVGDDVRDCAVCQATYDEITAFIIHKQIARDAETAWSIYDGIIEPHNWLYDLGFAEWLKEKRR